MIRFLLRTLGVVFLAAAFVFAVYDGARAIADRTLFPPHLTPVNETWTAIQGVIHAPTLQQLQPAVEQISPWLWDPVAVRILDAPTLVVLGAIGALLILVGRRKKPLIGYAR